MAHFTFTCAGAYFCMNMVLITLSTFIAVVIIQTHIRGDRKNKVPPWLKRVRSQPLYTSLCPSVREKETHWLMCAQRQKDYAFRL